MPVVKAILAVRCGAFPLPPGAAQLTLLRVAWGKTGVFGGGRSAPTTPLASK